MTAVQAFEVPKNLIRISITKQCMSCHHQLTSSLQIATREHPWSMVPSPRSRGPWIPEASSIRLKRRVSDSNANCFLFCSILEQGVERGHPKSCGPCEPSEIIRNRSWRLTNKLEPKKSSTKTWLLSRPSKSPRILSESLLPSSTIIAQSFLMRQHMRSRTLFQHIRAREQVFSVARFLTSTPSHVPTCQFLQTERTELKETHKRKNITK